MKTAVLIMKRTSLAQGLMAHLEKCGENNLFYEEDYTAAARAVCSCRAGAALVEITEDARCDADYCLELCARLRKEAPHCRLLLMCPESSEQAVKKAVEAKRNRLIDDFVFYDVSMEYLAAMLRSL